MSCSWSSKESNELVGWELFITSKGAATKAAQQVVGPEAAKRVSHHSLSAVRGPTDAGRYISSAPNVATQQLENKDVG